jgi:protein-L-isoaspartate(D-aspartate) O-methyltransferase
LTFAPNDGGKGMEDARARMVERQLRRGGIHDERVLAAMGTVPRESFVPPKRRKHAYDDGALPIGCGQTISQPWVVAAICEGLELTGSEEVLEVGTGSGYSAAVLALLARRVVSIELVEELAERARAALTRLGYENVEVQAGDGSGEVVGRQSFDAVAVHAAAPTLPPALARALRPGGRLVIPIAEGDADMLVAYHRTDEGGSGEPELRRRPIAPCRFVPLLGEGGFPRA